MTRRQSGLFPTGVREAPALILSAYTVTVAPGRRLPAASQPQPISHTAMQYPSDQEGLRRLLITYGTKSTSFTPTCMLTCGTRPLPAFWFLVLPSLPSHSSPLNLVFTLCLCPFPLLEVLFQTHSPWTRPWAVRPPQVLFPSLLSSLCCPPLTPCPTFEILLTLHPGYFFQFFPSAFWGQTLCLTHPCVVPGPSTVPSTGRLPKQWAMEGAHLKQGTKAGKRGQCQGTSEECHVT